MKLPFFFVFLFLLVIPLAYGATIGKSNIQGAIITTPDIDTPGDDGNSSFNVTFADGRYVNEVGDTMTGDLNMKNSPINIQNSNGATIGILSQTAPGTLRMSSTSGNNIGINGDSGGGTLIAINDLAYDIDFFVSGDTETYLLYTDAGNNRVGIGTNSPQSKLDVNGGLKVNSLITFAGSPDALLNYSDTDYTLYTTANFNASNVSFEGGKFKSDIFMSNTNIFNLSSTLSQLHINISSRSATSAVQIGGTASCFSAGATCIGAASKATTQGTAIGFGSNSSAISSLAMARNSMALNESSTAIGGSAKANAPFCTAIGGSALCNVSAINSTALGGNTVVNVNHVVGIGTYPLLMNPSLERTCDATVEGAIYYNGTTKKHYGCNSTAWNALY